ncbi:PDC sensor domain-containing protein [Brevibacillus sp. AY1]|uniref:PDC sensor domain-containing protein n=1 Tax=Brevibacillus sp. AY1 TaxID=2807621 RepID=UPI002455520D|nr:PDC sensor domain-containing protein [Brevibacillus sp. AY1]MDH4616216.1 PDC sensor domain-containing protein [Brevibacillus sp. AY1]
MITSPPELLQSIFQAWMEETDELEAVWLNQTNGDFLHSLPPAGIINAKRRPWFAGALQDEFYISAPYVSAITKRPCVTISILLKDSDGTPQGILGTDIRCHMI